MSREHDINIVVQTAAVTATILIAQQIASKSLRDGLFLTHFDVELLPVLTVVAAALSMVMIIVSGKLMARYSPSKFVPVLLTASAGLYLIEYLLVDVYPKVVSVSVYTHTVTFGAAVVSGFWSVVNERFDPATAKRVIGRIGAGATIGGLLGGIAVWQGTSYIRAEQLILVIGIANFLCAMLVGAIRGDADDPVDAEQPSTENAFSVIKSNRFLMQIGAFVFTLAFTTALFDYVFKARAATIYTNTDELVTFFALFYTITGAATIVVQQFLVPRLLQRGGVAPTLAVLPFGILVGGIGALLFPGFWAAAILRGIASSTENSTHRSGYELLYTPLRPDQKRATKLILDVGSDRVGTALGGVLALGMISVFVHAQFWMLALATLLSVLLLGILYALSRGYVSALAERMRWASADALADDADPTIGAELARDAILRTVAIYDDLEVSSESSTQLTKIQAAVSERLRARPKRALPDESTVEFAEDSEFFLSDDDDDPTVRAKLKSQRALTAHAIANLIDHLDGPHGGRIARHLARNSPQFVGQMSDALLDPSRSVWARGMLAHALTRYPTQRGVHALVLGLDDARFHVAHQCAIALNDLAHDHPELAPAGGEVFDWVLQELSRSSPYRRQTTIPEAMAVKLSPFYEHGRAQVSVQLVHVFTLLAIVLDRETLVLAMNALIQSDKQRGTAMEFLSNVLPLSVRTAMQSKLDSRNVLESFSLSGAQGAEIVESARKSGLDLASLRAAYRRQPRNRD